MTSDALRATPSSKTSVAPVVRRVRRSGRSATTETRRVPHDEIVTIAEGVVLPPGVTGLCMAVLHTTGGVLPNGTPNGLDGHTQYGPAWIIDWLNPTEPIALFDHQHDARELLMMLDGEEGELWQRKQRRLAAIAATEAAEASAEAEAKIARASSQKTVRRAIKRGDGDGSKAPSVSKEKLSVSIGREMSRRDRLRRASKTTS